MPVAAGGGAPRPGSGAGPDRPEAPGVVRVATWNVNSIKARLGAVQAWLEKARPDIVLLQETKTTAAEFPAAAMEDLGYNVAAVGQKAYNGVAILSRRPIEDVREVLPGAPAPPEARYIEAFTAGLRVASVYVPQGKEVGSERFRDKLAFFDRLYAHATALLALEEAVVLGGDLNVAPWPVDVYDPEALDGTLCYHADERAKLRKILYLGMVDAFRARHGEPGRYSWWDYRAGAWQQGRGMRIDHLLLSPQAADRLVECDIDEGPRARPKASDHTPVWCTLMAATPG